MKTYPLHRPPLYASIRHLLLLLAILVGALLDATAQVPEDSELYNTILELDNSYFTAYNQCDMETQGKLLSDDLEFYHDQGGLSTSKKEILQSIEVNICGKVTRSLVAGSVEVHEIKGFGAVEIGLHTFFNNREPDAISKPSRFVTVWKQAGDGWKMHRIISLH
ncbi:nuclear transport factor 2 family protein [Robiginitalea sp. SC105]|uniref:nuclear transport factor 2 family protein n=1 Tax=Robiginitalea sp. SC105 TaxID=2762332 RepID=UPI001639EB13|nr:nuclear transport factor 2 family protein [Robiginitalea sp. SC105]MBC2839352.1 nuclear transport factor 2 family protein [Robiginitalea sp. SC105]